MRAYLSTRELEGQVGNGGFAQAAFNSPDAFRAAADGGLLMGRPDLADLVRRADEVAAREVDDEWYASWAGWAGAERLEMVRRSADEFDTL